VALTFADMQCCKTIWYTGLWWVAVDCCCAGWRRNVRGLVRSEYDTRTSR